jgi:diadenosine tetraphosphate (Ap4A) HIT family hydrolase
MYLSLDKAPMHPHHCLLIPVEHHPSALALSPIARSEVSRYIAAVRKFYQSQGCELVGFERFMRLRKIGGNHCHINLVPISKAASASARQCFEETAAQDGFSLDHLAAGTLDDLAQAVGDSEYFAAYLPDGSMLATKIQKEPRHPMDFGRRVLAQLLGCPDKAHPKVCALSQAEEEDLAEKFKAGFKDFDVMG